MKILIVTQYFWPETFLVNGLAEELEKKGHQVTVLTGLPNYPKGEFSQGYGFFSGPWTEKYKNIQVLRVPLIARGKNHLTLALNYLSFVFFGTLFSFRARKDFDVLFCFVLSPITTCLPALFIRWLTKKPLVVWVQDLWPESISAVGAIKSERILNLIGLLVRFIYKRCDLILAQSKAFHQSISKWGGEESRIHYLPNWAEPFCETSERPPWVRNLPKGFKIGFAGNIGKAQDIPNLLKAAELLKNSEDIQWIIVGDGSEKAWLDQQIQECGLQKTVFALGRKPYNDMLPFFKSCEALLVSLTDEFIFSLTIPSKVQAYLSSGRPIISAVRGEGSRVITEAQAGFAVPPENAHALVEAVLKMKNLEPSVRQKMGENGLEFFNLNFEKNHVVSELDSILSRVKIKP